MTGWSRVPSALGEELPVRDLAAHAGSDALGPYREISFSYGTLRDGIRLEDALRQCHVNVERIERIQLLAQSEYWVRQD